MPVPVATPGIPFSVSQTTTGNLPPKACKVSVKLILKIPLLAKHIRTRDTYLIISLFKLISRLKLVVNIGGMVIYPFSVENI